MHYGFIVPDLADARPDSIAALACDAEAAGWDAIFFWDGDWGFSPWVVLAAMAERTERIRLGAILHPLPWRQPWLFARDTATLDQLSRGRLIVSVGLGAVHDDDWARGRTRFGMSVDRKLRAQQLDEGLAVVSRLWSGQPVTFHGRHYQLDEFSITPTPAQGQRIPVWAVAAWGRRTSVERLRHCDGVLLDQSVAPADLAAIRAFVGAERALPGPFEVVMEGDTRGDSADEVRARVQRWSELGVTWWVESMWEPRGPLEAARRRIAQGPPEC